MAFLPFWGFFHPVCREFPNLLGGMLGGDLHKWIGCMLLAVAFCVLLLMALRGRLKTLVFALHYFLL